MPPPQPPTPPLPPILQFLRLKRVQANCLKFTVFVNARCSFSSFLVIKSAVEMPSYCSSPCWLCRFCPGAFFACLLLPCGRPGRAGCMGGEARRAGLGAAGLLARAGAGTGSCRSSCFRAAVEERRERRREPKRQRRRRTSAAGRSRPSRSGTTWRTAWTSPRRRPPWRAAQCLWRQVRHEKEQQRQPGASSPEPSSVSADVTH